MVNIIEQSNGVKTISINTPYEGLTALVNGKANQSDLDATNAQLSDIMTSIYVEGYPIQIPETDDTARIQRAINDASKLVGSSSVNGLISPSQYVGSVKVILAPKTYVISGTLNVYTGVKLVGESQLTTNISVSQTLGSSLTSIISLKNNNKGAYTSVPEYEKGGIENIRLLGNNKATFGITNVISGDNVAKSNFKNIEVEKCQVGVFIEGFWDCTFENVRTQESIIGWILEANPTKTGGNNNNTFIQCGAVSCSRFGFYLDASGSTFTNLDAEKIGDTWQGNFSTNNTFSYNGKNYTQDPNGTEIDHPIGVLITGQSHNLKFTVPWFEAIYSGTSAGTSGLGVCIETRNDTKNPNGITKMTSIVIDQPYINSDIDWGLRFQCGLVNVKNTQVNAYRKYWVDFSGTLVLTLDSCWYYDVLYYSGWNVTGNPQNRIKLINTLKDTEIANETTMSLTNGNYPFRSKQFLWNHSAVSGAEKLWEVTESFNSGAHRNDIKVIDQSGATHFIESVSLDYGVKTLEQNVGKFTVSSGATSINVPFTHAYTDLVVHLCPLDAYSASLMNQWYLSAFAWNQFTITFTASLSQSANFKFIAMPVSRTL